MSSPLIVTAAEAPAPLEVIGERVTVLASGAQTGSYEIFHQAGPEGVGPPPHSHPWDEAFYVLDGNIAFGIDDQSLVVAAGTLVHLPAGTTHWFRFGSGGGTMLSMTSRAGAAEFFSQVAREISPESPDLGALIGIATSNQLNIPIPTA